MRSIDTHGKHLFLRWDNGLTIHSHLRMSGRWRIFERGFDQGRLSRAAWLVIETAGHSIVQFRGPILELIRDSRMTFDPYLRRLGPDVLAEELDWQAIHTRLRSDDPTRPVADALLDQRTLAGIGNLWKNESLYECRIDPWRPLSDVSDEDLERVVRKARDMMLPGGAPRRAPVGRGGVRAGRQTVPPLRRPDPRARAVGREPHDLLVPRPARSEPSRPRQARRRQGSRRGPRWRASFTPFPSRTVQTLQ